MCTPRARAQTHGTDGSHAVTTWGPPPHTHRPPPIVHSSTSRTQTPAACARTHAHTPTPEEVSRRAYENYESEGYRDGSDVEHWLAAEAGLLAERNF